MNRSTTFEFCGDTVTIEAGELAQEAHGAVLLRQGDTAILATVVFGAPSVGGRAEFLGLSVEYRERASAAGRIPGGWGRREGRQGDHEILTGRAIDRSLRPLLQGRPQQEIVVTVTVFGASLQADLETLAILAASAAVHESGVAWTGPVGAVRVALLDETFVAMPDDALKLGAELEVLVALTQAGVVMLEGSARQAPRSRLLEAIAVAQTALTPFWFAVDSVREGRESPLHAFVVAEGSLQADEDLPAGVASAFEAIFDGPKAARPALLADLEGAVDELAASVSHAWRTLVRTRALAGSRLDGRALGAVRPLSMRVGPLPGNHGSALFSRGTTQALVSVTVGGPDEGLVSDTLFGRQTDRFMLHYNFPSFAVGEVHRARGPGRREIGHGTLARRALAPVLPNDRDFPLTVRVVSDILGSDGSSSMATVCGASLALMDAGIQVSDAVAGVAMGVVLDGGKWAILTDLTAEEDHLGDMDFKLAGTAQGITAFQLDNKAGTLPLELLQEGLDAACEAIQSILTEMAAVIDAPRAQLAGHAPHFALVRVPVARIGTLIGAGGKTVQDIQSKTHSRIEIKEDGQVRIIAKSPEHLAAAVERVEAIGQVLVVGRTYEGEVISIKDFGAVVRIGDHDGLIHISELGVSRVAKTEEAVSVGQRVEVQVLGADERGRLRFSRRAALMAV